MVRRAGMSALCCCFAACGGDRVASDIDPEIDRVAALNLSFEGALLEASGILPRSLDAPVRLTFTGAEALHVLGWTSAQLQPLSPPGPPRLAMDPLRVASPCAASLPPPAWERALSADGPPLPRLTADWLDTCPALDAEDLRVDVRCTLSFCPSYGRVTGCALAIDFPECQLGRVEGRVQPDGSGCFDPAASALSCGSVAPPADAMAKLSCAGGCTMLVHDLGRVPREPPVTIARRELAVVPRPQPVELGKGYFSDLALLPGRVYVAGYGGGQARWDACGQQEPSTLHVLRADDLAPIQTSTLPPCLTRLGGGRSPSGEALVALFDAGTAGLLVASLDRDGRILAQRSLVLGSGDRTLDQGAAVELRQGRDGEQALLLLGRGEAELLVLALDPRDLRELARSAPIMGRPAALVVLPGDGLVVYEDLSDEAIWLEVLGTEIVQRQKLGFSARGIVTGEATYDPTTGRSFGSASGLDSGVDFRSQDGDQVKGLYFDAKAHVTTLAPFPGRPGILAVAATPESQISARLSLFDASDVRFLPGAWTIGQGYAARMKADEQGNLWTLLPQNAELVRLTPR